MIGMLKDLLSGTKARDGGADRNQLAAAALLVEAATLDGHMAEAEHARILVLLKDRFGLDEGRAAELLAEAQAVAGQAVELHGFTRTVKDHFDEAGRIRLIEMLWEVAYADGLLHDYEANLVRRVAGLLYVSDRDSGIARKAAMARLGLGEGLA